MGSAYFRGLLGSTCSRWAQQHLGHFRAKLKPCLVAFESCWDGNSYVTQTITNVALTGLITERGAGESPGESRRIGDVLRCTQVLEGGGWQTHPMVAPRRLLAGQCVPLSRNWFLPSGTSLLSPGSALSHIQPHYPTDQALCTTHSGHSCAKQL